MTRKRYTEMANVLIEQAVFFEHCAQDDPTPNVDRLR